MERLVRKEEYASAKKFMSGLRARTDPAPQLLQPYCKKDGGRVRRCVHNVSEFCKANPDYEAVSGFKLWTMPTFGIECGPPPFVAPVHFVVRHKGTGKFKDVTPPDKGDEGTEVIFVPSSRVYPGWSAEDITELYESGMEPRAGLVATGPALAFKQAEGDELLNKGSPEELKLIVYPTAQGLRDWLSNAQLDAQLLGQWLAAMPTARDEFGNTRYVLTADDVRALKFRPVAAQ